MSQNIPANLKNIAFIYAKNRAINYTLIDSLIDELRLRAVNVDEFNYFNNQNIYDKEVLSAIFKNREAYDAVFVLDLGKTFDYRLHKSFYKCPIVLICGDDPQNFSKNYFYENVKNYIKRKIYTYDQQQQIIGNSIIARQYDIVLTPHKPCIEKYKSHGIKNVFWLPYWLDTNQNKIDEAIEKKYDLATVMSPNRARNKFFNLFSKEKIDFKNLTGIKAQETSNHYQAGRLIFNRSSFNEINIRVFEALGNKSVLLTNKISENTGLYDLFKENEDFFSYKSKKDLINLIKRLLKDPSEITRVSNNGYNKTIAEHTQRNRVDFILQILNKFTKKLKEPQVSINIISWNRPVLLELTLSSLINSLKNSSIDFEIALLDQGSQHQTLQIINKYLKNLDKVIYLNENIGISKAFEKLFELSSGQFIITLENDWWCNSTDDKWLIDSLKILQSSPNEIAFIKLRKLFDRQYGLGSLLHEPWSVKPFPYDTVEIVKFATKKTYYRVAPPYNCFTFNPVIMDKEFRHELSSSYKDLTDNATPLRSGEELPQKFWQNQTKWKSGALLNGPFTHAGFPSLRDHIIYLPYFLVRNFFNRAISNIKGRISH